MASLTTKAALLKADGENNVYIYSDVESSYRSPGMSFSRALYTGLTQLHTETLNIWSHLIGLIMMARLYWVEQEWDLRLYLAACCVTLLCSCLYHTFGSTSTRNGNLLVMLDWQAVLVAIAASSWLIAIRQGVGDTMVPIICGTWVATSMSLLCARHMLLKLLSCVMFAVLGLVAWMWQAIVRAADWRAMQSGIGPMYMFNIVGVGFVCCAAPERQLGWVVLTSHVIMHVAVVCGMLSLWQGYR